jgi:hypothetical protein
MSFETGASTSSVYNTAHHAFMNIARIRKGKGTASISMERRPLSNDQPVLIFSFPLTSSFFPTTCS